jgi:hypothetical protein
LSEQWLLEKGDLVRERGDDLRIYSEDEYQRLMIFFVNCKRIVSLLEQCTVNSPSVRKGSYSRLDVDGENG